MKQKPLARLTAPCSRTDKNKQPSAKGLREQGFELTPLIATPATGAKHLSCVPRQSPVSGYLNPDAARQYLDGQSSLEPSHRLVFLDDAQQDAFDSALAESLQRGLHSAEALARALVFTGRER